MAIAGSTVEARREHHWRQANSRNLGGAASTGGGNLGQSLRVSGDLLDPQSEQCNPGNTVGFLESGGLTVRLWLFLDKPLNCVKLNFLAHKNETSEVEAWHSFSECSENLPFGYGPYKMFLIFFYPCVTGAKAVFHPNSFASNLFSSSFYVSVFCLLV